MGVLDWELSVCLQPGAATQLFPNYFGFLVSVVVIVAVVVSVDCCC